ncbi:Carbonic anhydrase [Brachionus plicatilis]|uniref:Carbonic anhydrase n=1 Tax=Brachionus plicatilis TaxID=10195 RepID=A0A3M7RP15_BRAPC|nr:Carbonic anhydrase [Brachionus plicatilis]
MGNKKSKKAEIRQLTESEIQSILENTDYNRDQITEFHQNFTSNYFLTVDFEYLAVKRSLFSIYQKVYPSGILNKDQFCTLYNNLHPAKKCDKYLDQIFQMFDADKDGIVTFGEFMITVFLQGRKEPEEKLRLVFRMYDYNCNGFIEENEMEAILHTVADNCDQIEYEELKDWDQNKNGQLNEQEFRTKMRLGLIISLAIFKCFFCSDWNYEGHGPDFWLHEYPQCAGNLQSPINIQHSNAIFDPELGQLTFHNYDINLKWRVTNTGATIIANQADDSSSSPYITGSDFKVGVKYYLKQFHFHWGFNVYQGSEHLIDSIKYPLEIHLVHMSELNETTVLSFLFQITKDENKKLKILIDEIGRDVAIEDSHVNNFSLDSIIPDNDELKRDGFYRYMGSLTTPPCTEGVKWTVFRTKINISESQMMEFYKNEIDFNHRQAQELNDRILTINVYNFKNEKSILNNFVKKIIKNLLKSSLLKINFYNYDKIFNWNITYREYQINVKPVYDSNLRILIDGSDFNEIYELSQFHFHWGYNIYQGSEHQIDFEKFPLEVHLVHESKNGQLAVLAFLFRISNESKIQSFFKNIEFIDNPNKFSIARFSLNSLIPIENSENLKSYFRYKGSLTIPP